MRTSTIGKGNLVQAVLACLFIMSPVLADAAAIRMDTIPSLRIEEGYQSNVYDSSTNEVDSLSTRLAPGLAIRFTAPDDVKLQFSGRYERTWYHDRAARRADDSTWNFRVDSSGAWKLSPTFSVRPSAYYLRTPDSYRRVQLLPSDDPNLPPVSIANYGTAKTDEFGGGLGFEYLASPNLTVGIRGNYSQKKFPGDNTVDFGLTDSKQYGGGFSIVYTVTPRSTLGITGSMNHYTYDNNVSTNNFFAGVQFGYQLTPVLRFDASVGASQVREERNAGAQKRKDTSPAGSASLSYTTPDSVAKFFGSATYTGGSGYGETTRQYTAGFTFTNRLAPEWSWTFGTAYQISKSVFTSDAVDIKTLYGNAGIAYNPLEWITIDGRLSLDRQTSDGVFGRTIDNYAAYLGLTLGKSFNLY